MKRRLRKVLNFFAFNLLFFALYLNFIHKDSAEAAIPATPTSVTGTVLVENPEKYLGSKATEAVQLTPAKNDAGTALQMSIN